VLLARLDTDGNRIWARKSGGGNAAALDSAHAVAVDAVGGVYIGGEFTSLTFTNGSVGLTNRGFTDGFIAKHDLAGNLLWMRQIGAAGSDSVRGLAVLPGTNGIAVAGQFSRTNDFGGSLLASTGGQLPDAFAASYTAEGALRWVRSFGGPATDSAADVAVDPLGNLFVTGSYQGTATFGDKTSVSIADTTDIFALRLDTNGVLVFMQQAGGDDIGGDTGLGIAVDGDGNGVFTGSFRGTLVAGSNSAESTGGNNAFVSRLVPPPSVHIRPEAGQIIISWPSAWPGFLLEANGGGLRQTNWTDTALTPVLVGDRYFITNTVTTNLQFFRLRRP
jgi:hypothetical protein